MVGRSNEEHGALDARSRGFEARAHVVRGLPRLHDVLFEVVGHDGELLARRCPTGLTLLR